jgi:hypothetical protein
MSAVPPDSSPLALPSIWRCHLPAGPPSSLQAARAERDALELPQRADAFPAYARVMAAASDHLGAERAAEALAAGRALSADAGIALALAPLARERSR